MECTICIRYTPERGCDHYSPDNSTVIAALKKAFGANVFTPDFLEKWEVKSGIAKTEKEYDDTVTKSDGFIFMRKTYTHEGRYRRIHWTAIKAK